MPLAAQQTTARGRLALADQQDPDHAVVVRDPRVVVDDPAVRIPDRPRDRDVLAVDGPSIRSLCPRRSDDVALVLSKPRTTLLTLGRLHETLRPFGTLQISKVTMPGDACVLMRTGYFVSLRKRIVCDCETVASRPSG